MIRQLIINLISACLKLLSAWIAYALATWMQLPEWAVLCVVIMAVESTFLKANRS